MASPLSRWVALGVALVVGAAGAVVPLGAASAAPGPGAVEEEEPPLLRDVIAAAGRNYLKAKAAAQESKKRQLQLNLRLRAAQSRLDELRPQVAEFAAESYRTGELSAAAALLDSASPDSFLSRAVRLNEVNIVNDHRLRELNAAVAELDKAKAALDAEVRNEQNQLQIMARQKREAEKALALVGGKSLTGGFVAAESPVAKAAPRNASGGFSAEPCNKDDPTTSGCVTARTLHAYKEARRAGFDREVGCFRAGGPFEHPKGLACDWSVRYSGYAPAATPDQRLYGNNLAAFLVRNADRLGVLYIIWYRKIWFPATGWKSYSGASAHVDHVHMSMV